MKDNGILFGRLYRVDFRGAGPPWPLQVYNAATGRWEAVGAPAGGVLYEYGANGLDFVLTAEGDVIGVTK